MMDVSDVCFYGLSITLFLFFILYYYITSSYNYWQARNVPYSRPSFPFGNLGDIVMGRKSLIDLLLQQYKQFESQRYFGIFNFSRPVLVLRDPSLIESILITDFSYFCDRVDGVTKNKDLLAYYLGNLQGNVWRQLRQKFNKAFSNAKLKQMTDQISVCADRLVERISEYESENKPINGDCFGYGFYQETTASCAFGIECGGEGIKEFCKNVKRLLFGKLKVIHSLIICYLYLPQYAKYLYYIPAVEKFVGYFRHLTSAAIEVRKESGSKRNDFLQILIDLKEEELEGQNISYDDNQSELKNIADLSLKPSNKYREQQFSSREVEPLLSERFITSQMFLFMGYGLDLSAVGFTFLFRDLASRPEVQRLVQQEIDSVVHKFGSLTYEAVQQLHYLDMVLQECARMQPGPGFPFVTRVCQSPYQLPGSDLVLEKGTMVLVPSCAVHRDPLNYPDPDIFDPERFRDNHFKPSATYLPFGAGPRMCIALKLVMLKMKLAAAKVLQKYSVGLSRESQQPVTFARQFIPKMMHTVYFIFEKRSPSAN